MFVNMLLAHFIADYVLQPNALASWKSRNVFGVLAHGAIVTVVTMLFAIPQPQWVVWALLIGILHTVIDLVQFELKGRYLLDSVNPLTIFSTDQILHFIVIVSILHLSGECVSANCLIQDVGRNGFWTVMLGYVLVSMPAWVAIEFLVSGLVLGKAPDFCYASRIKYTCIVERVLILTCVLLGQYILIPLVALTRTAMTISSDTELRRSDSWIAELLMSVSITLLIGILLRQVIF